jgi:hypothetical protein
MARLFQKESEVEYWMQPYTGLLMLPGYRRELHTNTRLFWDYYWQLLWLGYQETQLADYVIRRRWERRPPVPVEIAFAKAVYYLADRRGLKPSRAFNYFPEGNHPRDYMKRQR